MTSGGKGTPVQPAEQILPAALSLSTESGFHLLHSWENIKKKSNISCHVESIRNSVSADKVVREHSHLLHLCIVYRGFRAMTELSRCNRDVGPTKPKILSLEKRLMKSALEDQQLNSSLAFLSKERQRLSLYHPPKPSPAHTGTPWAHSPRCC